MSAAQYYTRAPRYVFGADDSGQFRFAEMGTKGIVHDARIRDLSETGLAFAMESLSDLQMDEGDLLKIEVPLPGKKTIACFATVVRIEYVREWDPDYGDRGHVTVGVQFRNLPSLHLKSIRQSLEGRLNDETVEPTPNNTQHVFSFVGLSVLLLVTFFAMSLPASTWVSVVRALFGSR